MPTLSHEDIKHLKEARKEAEAAGLAIFEKAGKFLLYRLMRPRNVYVASTGKARRLKRMVANAARCARDGLAATVFFFAVQALVSDAEAATCKEKPMGDIPIATDLPRSEEAIRDLLQLAGVEVDINDIAQWSDWKIWKAEDWAAAVHLHASDNRVPVPVKPSFLNRYNTSDGGVVL